MTFSHEIVLMHIWIWVNVASVKCQQKKSNNSKIYIGRMFHRKKTRLYSSWTVMHRYNINEKLKCLGKWERRASTLYSAACVVALLNIMCVLKLKHCAREREMRIARSTQRIERSMNLQTQYQNHATRSNIDSWWTFPLGWWGDCTQPFQWWIFFSV